MVHPYRIPKWLGTRPLAACTTTMLALFGAVFVTAQMRFGIFALCPGDPTPEEILVFGGGLGAPLVVGALLGGIYQDRWQFAPLTAAVLTLIVFTMVLEVFEGADLPKLMSTLLAFSIFGALIGIPVTMPMTVAPPVSRGSLQTQDFIGAAFGASILLLGLLGLYVALTLELHPEVREPPHLWDECTEPVHRAEAQQLLTILAIFPIVIGGAMTALSLARLVHRRKWLARVCDGSITDHRVVPTTDSDSEELPRLVSVSRVASETIECVARDEDDPYREQKHWRAVARV